MSTAQNKFLIGGLDPHTLVKEHGGPLYVYEAQTIRDQYKRIMNSFAACKTRIKYACKANTNINILRILKDLGSGLDTVSIQEVWLGLEAGFAPEDILYTPNCVSFEEIELAVKEGVKINIDNIGLLEQFGNKYGDSIPVCLRITPHIIAGGNAHIQTGHIDSKFGISIHQMRHTSRVIAANNIVVDGIHMHTGSDILDANVFLNGLEILLEQARNFPDLKYVDCGSGFKVAYRTDDPETDIEHLGLLVSDRFNAFCKEVNKDLELWFEPGKFLVSESGYFLSKVNVVKQTVSTAFAGLDCGFNHFIRPKLYGAYHKILNASNPDGVFRVYTVVGYICETDTFAVDRKIREVREGDILAFKNAGAYCYAMSSNYNSRFRPAEVLVDEGEAKLIRRRESLEDLLHSQIYEK